MRKIVRLVKIITVLAAAAGVFYLGWIQIKLDENTYAVAFTKSSGYLEKVFRPGKFSWTPYRLVPGNCKLIRFKILPRTVNAEETGTLASGKVYGKFMPGQPDFSYSIAFTARYILKPEALPSLVKNNSLTPDTLEDFYAETDRKITAIVTGRIKKMPPDTRESLILHPETAADAVISAIEEYEPYVDLATVTFSRIQFPDTELYKKAKENYFSYLKDKNSVENKIKKASAEKEVMEASKIELLKRYGEILKEYPELVQVLSANPSLRSEILPSITLTGADTGE